jgi:hypothetical protein
MADRGGAGRNLCKDGSVSDDVSGYPGAPPGWYADPAGGPSQRWWDGYAWTDAVAVPAQPPSPPAFPPPPPPPWAVPPGVSRPGAPSSAVGVSPGASNADARELVGRAASMAPVARLAFVFFGIEILVGLITTRLNLAQLRTEGHQMRLIFHAAANGQPAPTFSNPPTLNAVQSTLILVGIVATVIGCIWQYRAASASRSLGLPSTRSPGWGVGCWFVPVVNLWMPYEAIRDCLPADDPNRRLILRWWLSVVGGQVLAATATATAFFSGAVSLAFSIPAALFALGIVANAPRVVQSITAAHHARFTP